MKGLFLFLLCVCLALLMGCDEQKFPVESLATGGPNANIGDTLYVQQFPNWEGFQQPRDVTVGNEPFVYVADTDNDRIVMLDIAGNVIGFSKPIRRPVSLAQDKRLQLLVCAEFDTTLPGRTAPTTFGAVYRFDLPSANHFINVVNPKRVFFESGDSTRRYTGVSFLFNNQYYISRTGPKNEIQRVDRDNAVILFSKDDQPLTPMTATFSPDGTGLLSIHTLTGVATLPGSRSVEFVFAQTGQNSLFKVQWIRLVAEGQTTNYVSKFYPSVDGDIDLLRINRFANPEGLTLDPSGNLYVVDAATDSLYRFSSRGIERYSFGGTGSGEKQFRQPSGVAVFDRTVYVADRGNNRVVRFKLSTDLR